jgi:ribosomal protein S12 methylthiotransferase accessory factor
MIELHRLNMDEPPFAAVVAALPVMLQGVLGRLARCFQLRSEWAPGLLCLGGELRLTPEEAAAHGAAGLSVTATGLSLTEALTALLGEAAERLSEFERPGDIVAADAGDRAGPASALLAGGWIDEAMRGASVSRDRIRAWMRAVDLADNGRVDVPADLCLRRRPERRQLQPVGALSAGCAAGQTSDMAAQRAILELVERDAAALWWLGGRPPRLLPAGSAALRAGMDLLQRLRNGQVARTTRLLDLTTDLELPAIAAVSIDADGTGLACGLAARSDAGDAACAALRELMQMELSAPLARLKLSERGEDGLNDADRRHLRRSALQTERCPLLEPKLVGEAGGGSASRDLSAPTLGRLLTRRGVRLAMIDLTRSDIGVPVLRAMSPDLQPLASWPVTQRLASVIAAHGGGEPHTAGTPLM